jgi:UDP-N-acetylmuramoyl-L-alanyl-D-glutamate--2,6-diaminopimelate ligase
MPLLQIAKRVPFVSFLYRLPGVSWGYHFFLALAGALWYSFPSRRIEVIGVTGTKGKTTTLELLNAMLEAGGHRTALLSSLRIKIGSHSEKNRLDNTMPGRFFIQRFLRRAVSAGCNVALVEVTSQGVVMSRHRFIRWRAGVLTNLAPEHIEAHGSFENYRVAKLSFLKAVARQGGAVFLNSEDEHFLFFRKSLEGYVLVTPYRRSDAAAVAARRNGKLEGEFYMHNIAAAAAVARSLGVNDMAIASALTAFSGVPGRLQFVQEEPFTAVVDYAHTPDSLKAVYKTLCERLERGKRKGERGKLICVFGSCGGGRDRWKRPEMGKVASSYCDRIILTNEDPYDENPGTLLSEIRAGVGPEKLAVTSTIVDRREAIRKALSEAAAGDAVICTGKGSESWIHVAGGKRIPWDEAGILRELLAQK